MLELKSNLKNLNDFVSYTRQAAEKAKFTEASVNQIELATEEAIVNIIN